MQLVVVFVLAIILGWRKLYSRAKRRNIKSSPREWIYDSTDNPKILTTAWLHIYTLKSYSLYIPRISENGNVQCMGVYIYFTSSRIFWCWQALASSTIFYDLRTRSFGILPSCFLLGCISSWLLQIIYVDLKRCRLTILSFAFFEEFYALLKMKTIYIYSIVFSGWIFFFFFAFVFCIMSLVRESM